MGSLRVILAILWPLVFLLLALSIRKTRDGWAIRRRVRTVEHDWKGSPSFGPAPAKSMTLRERWSSGPLAAALRLRASEYILFRIGSFLVPFVLGLAARGVVGGLVLGTMGIVALALYFRNKQRRWLADAEESLPEFLREVGSALRAGSSLSQAMALVAEETHGPLGDEIRRVLRREALGFSTNETLMEITRRIPSRDLSLAMMAIMIQREVGGSLADLLDNIVRTIVERQRLKTEIRILTAQGRYSGWLLTFLPFILGLMLWFTDPAYMGALFHNKLGWAMLGSAAGSVAIGGVLINRLVKAPEM